ncbi:MAG: hypothetical protein ACPHK3_02490 [Candidatus Poseidoniaceae archaeon]
MEAFDYGSVQFLNLEHHISDIGTFSQPITKSIVSRFLPEQSLPHAFGGRLDAFAQCFDVHLNAWKAMMRTIEHVHTRRSGPRRNNADDQSS